MKKSKFFWIGLAVFSVVAVLVARRIVAACASHETSDLTSADAGDEADTPAVAAV